ncbi:MAG: hypothetical protein AAFR16_11855, partial [Pseudomonadota bacterium]
FRVAGLVAAAALALTGCQTTAPSGQQIAAASSTGVAAGGEKPLGVPLVEGRDWRFNPAFDGRLRGPERAEGIVLYIQGSTRKTGTEVVERTGVHSYLRPLHAQDWDVVRLSYVHRAAMAYRDDVSGALARAIKTWLAARKAEGYRSIVVVARSAGAWTALKMGAALKPEVDALVLSAIAAHGVGRRRGLNTSAMLPMLAAYDGPPVLMSFFEGDPYDENPAARVAAVRQTLAGKTIPHLIIDRPAGYSGHSVGWMPAFDYTHGPCIRDFLTNAQAYALAVEKLGASADLGPCPTAPLRREDLRWRTAVTDMTAPVRELPAVEAARLLRGKTIEMLNYDFGGEFVGYFAEDGRYIWRPVRGGAPDGAARTHQWAVRDGKFWTDEVPRRFFTIDGITFLRDDGEGDIKGEFRIRDGDVYGLGGVR